MKEWYWQFINEHIENFNNHRLTRSSNSDRIYVDEIFSRWYGLGGDWINLGLPHDVQMDSNTETGL